MANKIKKKRFPVKPKEQGVLPWLVDHQGNIYAGGGILGALTGANKAMDASKLGGLMGGASGISGIAGGIASAASNAISGGMSTGVGGAMQTIGGLASNIPGVGGLIGAGVNVLGGLVNRAFGSQINEEFVNETKAQTAEAANKQFDNSSIESVIQQQMEHQDLGNVQKSQVGKDGWFSSKAKNLTAKLNKQRQAVNLVNDEKINLALEGADEMQDLDLLANFAAYGGQLFKDGGGIHIKKANRGKFTEYCGGKVTSECIARGKRSSSPAVRKRATFAQNARGWKHGDGGPLDREFVERMNIKLGRTPSGYPSEQGLEIVSPEFDILLGGAKLLQSAGKGIAKGVSRAITNDGVSKGSFKRAVYNMDDFSKYADAQFHAPIKIIIDKGSRYLSKKLTPKSDKIGKTVRRTWNQYRGMESAGELPSIFQMGAKYISDIDKNNNKKAYGGSLVHGGDFSNGITMIGNGGTHEQNPFEGVQMGLDPQGVPNLVEEGEVVFNDYVFSNRLKVPKKDRKRLRLKEGTFADAAEKLQKESAERPNDPISRRGLEASMNRLAGIQEGVRERKSGNKFADGGKKKNYRDVEVPMAGINTDYSGQLPTRLTAPKGVIPIEEQVPDSELAPTWMRYAPAVGSALGVFSDAIGLTNTPDYAPAEMIGGAITPVKPVGARQINNRLTYKPLDTNYELNKLDANQAAQRRALINTSGGNRATAAANLIAANANYGNQMGDLHRQAELYNQQQRQQVEGFNRGTNQFNAEAQMRADLADAQQAQQMNELRLKQKSAQAQMYDTANMRSSMGRAANLTNLFENIGGIGQENFSRNMITSNPALLYDLDSSGRVQYKKNKKKKGGRLTYGR